MIDIAVLEGIASTTFADVLSRDRVMDFGIHALWQPIPHLVGIAYTVRVPAGDNLMVHAAIYRAAPGSILVIESGDTHYAVAGGNVCAVAQKRGIRGFVIDGVIRDVGELRARQFPVFARGLSPIPGGKHAIDILNNAPVMCGGVEVAPGDIVVADEEGIVVIPSAHAGEILQKAQARIAKDREVDLDAWEADHHARIDAILKQKGFEG